MKEWSYHPSPAIQRSISENLTVFPRERDMTQTIVRFLWNIALRLFLKIYFRLQITGKEHLPRNQSYVLAANHSSHLDAMCLLSALPMKLIDRAFAVAAKDYFFASFWRSFLAAILFNALPFDRMDKKRQGLELCADVLNVSEQVLIMFPEGTRSMSGEIQPFKQGIGILTAGTERWVVPAYIQGAFAAWPKGSRLPLPKRVRVTIGEPLHFKDVARTPEGFLTVARQTGEAIKRLKDKNDED